MPTQEIGKPWGEYLQETMRYWHVRGKLERIVECVCDRHGVPRHTAELEIYKGLLGLTAGNSCAASSIRSDNANP